MNIITSQDKAFWAMNFNMAGNNLLTVIQHLERKYAADLSMTRVEDKDIQEDEKGIAVDGTESFDYGQQDGGKKNVLYSSIFIALKDTKNTLLAVKIMKDLVHFLSFLREMVRYKESAHTQKIKRKDKKNGEVTCELKKIFGQAVSPTVFADILKNYASVLYDYRNFYTHTVHDGGRITSNSAKDVAFLDNLLNVNARTAKERFYADEENAMKPVRPQIGMKENPDFVCRFFEKDGAKKNTNFTEIGLAFFVSQFLEAKYVSQMLQVLIPQNDATRQLLQRVFSVSAVRLPRTRLTTDEELTPNSLGMDMVAELHKCPDELFDMLSLKDQNIFRFFDEDQNKENLFKRFGTERFAYLALNYLDLTEKLPTLRFHIDKGNFFYKTMPGHDLMNGEKIERRLSKRVFCFQRMGDAQREYKENRAKEGTLYHIPLDGVVPKGEFRVDMLPQYKIGKESIGICFGDEPEPDLKECIKRPCSRKPEAWLSLYELPIVVFLATQGKGKDVENVIKTYLENYNPMPVKVKPHTEDEKKKHLLEALNKEIDKTRRKLENYRKEMDVVYHQGGFKQGKRNKQPRFKGGTMALFIAKDVVRLQKPKPENELTEKERKHCGKITSANFAALQSSLALFDHHKDSLKMIFNKAGLTRNPDFMERLITGDMTSLERFFENYLDGKIKWLEKFKSNPRDCYILRHIVRRLDGTKEPRKSEKETVNLPRNLLAELVKKTVREKFPEQFAALPKRVINEKNLTHRQKTEPAHSSTFLIQKFHEWSGDGSQFFYDLPLDADSSTLSRLTKFLDPDKKTSDRKPHRIGIPLEKQKNLYDQWKKAPTLSTLYSIAEEMPKPSKTKGEAVAAPQNVDPLEEKIRRLQNIINDPKSSFVQRENAKMDLEELRKRPSQKRHFQKGKTEKPVKQDKHDESGASPADKFQRILTAYDSTFKSLRHERLQDIVLFYAARELCEFDRLQKGVKLRDIQTDDDHKLKFMLDEGQSLEWKFRIPSSPLIKESDLEFTLSGTMKVKNFGNFRRIINDVRTPSFLRLYHKATGKTEVDYDYLVRQLDEYDNGRKRVFTAIHNFERKVIRQAALEKPKNKKYIGFLTIVTAATDHSAERSLLVSFRNDFAHQRYPEAVFNNALAKISDEDERRFCEDYFAEEQEKLTAPKETSLTQHVIDRVVHLFEELV